MAAYDWLPLAQVEAWSANDVAAGGKSPAVIEQARNAAAAWVEERRPDLTDEGGVFTPPEMVTMGAVLLACRLLGRMATGATPTMGLALAASTTDPDVLPLLGLDRPGVG